MQAKIDGMLDEQVEDPISWCLFRTMLEWALKEMNAFVNIFDPAMELYGSVNQYWCTCFP
jgi:hypothetical protein